MTTNISVEKVKELIRLAEQARAQPEGRADGRQRSTWSSVDASSEPLTPQPAGDWQTALQRYILELPNGAIEELFALYRSSGGAGEGLRGQDIGVGPSGADAAGHDHATYLLSRPDLIERLRWAVQHL